LNNPRFAQQQSGIRIGAGPMTEGPSEAAVLAISLIKLPKRSRFLDLLGNVILFPSEQYVNASLSGMLGERTSGAKLDGGKAQVTVGQEEWNTHAKDGTVQNAVPLNAVQAFIGAKQSAGIALPADEKQLNLTGII
jgi:hypothetical protein